MLGVMQAVTVDWSTLTHLNLSTLDLTSIPSSVLSHTISNLVCIKLNYCKLSQEQMTAVIRAVSRSQVSETLGVTIMTVNIIIQLTQLSLILTLAQS